MKVVVPIDILLPDVDYLKSTLAFNEIFEKKGLKSLKTDEWNRIIPSILPIDTEFKYGKITFMQFKEDVTGIFSGELGQLIQITDNEFKPAWNAMLPDLVQLKEKAEALRDILRDKGHQLILMSATNYVHFDYIFTHSNMPFESIPVFLTYADQLSEVGLCKRIIESTAEPQSERFLFIINTSQKIPFESLKERQDAIRKKIKAYIAEDTNSSFKEIDNRDNITQQIVDAVDQLSSG